MSNLDEILPTTKQSRYKSVTAFGFKVACGLPLNEGVLSARSLNHRC